jgi:hypothetical protein
MGQAEKADAGCGILQWLVDDVFQFGREMLSRKWLRALSLSFRGPLEDHH